MWLVNLDGIWDGQADDDLRGTELALRLIRRTRKYLGRGDTWHMKPLATTALGVAVDPLSNDACIFSLSGAAARARWELRGEMVDAEVNPIHVRQVMDALFDIARKYRSERQGWMMVESVLDGMESALKEYSATRGNPARRYDPDFRKGIHFSRTAD